MGGMWVFWIAAIVIAILLVAGVWRSSRGSRTVGETPEEILKRRYARGEITKEEYEQRLKDIRS